MKQEIIQILDDIAKESMESFWESIGTDIYPTWISTAKERIQALWDGWIPVSETLPEFWWEYIVTRESWVVSTLEYDSRWWHWEWQEPMYWSRPTHWMNLPNPPKQ